MANGALNKAKTAQKDEFYTRLEDIERELTYYTGHFKGKTVYLNCDNPEISNFWKYFTNNFIRLAIHKLVATYYNREGRSYRYEMSEEGKIEKERLEGDGDFRSEEVIEILKGSDIVVTNPPFSLWRPYVHQLMEYNKKFLILGRQTATGYRDIFPYLKDQKMWTGVHANKVMQFEVPDTYELVEGKYEEINNKNYIKVPSISWYTNLGHEKQYKELDLQASYEENKGKYIKYDNYDAINVNRIKDIPYDWEEEMGVPITILNHFNFNQFEITGFRKGLDGKDLSVKGKKLYTRILIRKK